MLCYYLFFLPIGYLTLNLQKLFRIQWTIILVARVLLQVAVWELQALFAPGHIPPCIPHLTTEGGAAAGEEAEGKEGISGESVVVLDPEGHGVMIVGPYVGMVAEVPGDQGAAEALGEVVGQAPEEAVDMEFLVGLCLEDKYGAAEEEHGEEEHWEEERWKRNTGKRNMGKRKK